jgi:TonB-linked SusC/RagA family outer membrane protein
VPNPVVIPFSIHAEVHMTRILRSTKLLLGTFAVLALVTPALARGQAAVITGRVLSEQGQPLQGANILVPELNISVGTNQAGIFTITIPAARVSGQNVNIRARAIGYQPAVSVVTLSGGNQSVNFSLKRDLTELSAVVVTGVTAATEQLKLPFTVSKLDTTLMPVTASNAISQLQGKIPGASIVASSGRPGEAPDIVLRGPVSMDASGRSQQPLFLLDGVPLQGGLPDINPSDIENIEVVKGAAAAALYGARAGAGVINITTKSGKTAPPGVRFGARTEVGASNLERAFPLSQHTTLSLAPSAKLFCANVTVGGSPCGRYIDWDQEVQRINNSGEDFALTPQQFIGDLGFASAPTYERMTGTYEVSPWPVLRDPVGQLTTSAPYVNSSLDVRAKANETGVFASLGNLTQQGAVRYIGGFTRNSARVNVDQVLGSKVTANINTFYSQTTDHNNAGVLIGGGPFFAITRAPFMSDLLARDNLGRIVVNHNPLSNSSQNYNPLYDALYNHLVNRGTRFVGGASARYTPLEWLNFDGSFGYDRSTNQFNAMHDRGWRTTAPDPATAAGYVQDGSSDDAQYTTSLGAAANHSYGDLNARLTSRFVYGDQTLRSQGLYGEDLVVANLGTASAATKNFSIGSSSQTIRDMGFFVGTDFDYKDRYILSGLIRRDGSSLFGAGNRWQTFGRVAGAWIVSRESWWPAADAVSLFKVRASQGTTGQRPRFSAQYETYTIGAGGQLNPEQLGNRFLKPEINKELELGTDLEFFNRVGLNITHSKAVIDRQILPVPASSASGFSTVWLNAGEITNKTWEGTLSVGYSTPWAMNWTSRLIYDRTKSVITRLDVPEFTGAIGEANGSTVYKFRQGETIGTMYGTKFVTQCSELPRGFSNQCSMTGTDLNAAYRPNSQGYIVWVGAGNGLNEGITRNLWRANQGLGNGPWGNRTNWGMPITLRDSSGVDSKGNTIGPVSSVPLGGGLPKYHWGFSQSLDWKSFNVYGLLDAVRGQKVFNVQYAWSLGDLTSGEIDQSGKSVEDARPVGYYWRQGPSSSPVSGSTAGVGGFYDVLHPNSYNVEDASYVKLRELSVNYNVGRLFGAGDWKLGVVGRNLKTWSKFRGFDPEQGTASGPLNSAVLQSSTTYSYPKMRSFTVQLSTSF